MTLPTIHRNGTSPIDLLDDVLESKGAVTDAIQRLQHNGPNARDYYPQGAGAFSAAVTEHEARIQRLASVKDELEALAEHIARHT